ncbi:helix-turn-helix transcriptional regulator [Flavihumibacter petaseus]|uniref:Putative DeoR family transcriptional regulator n=1 Tax=Flavihumibacter petaseus NBRC 106054 TaxID=1220578 RepID=A0A0E9N3V7_9BACT|nr:YafY family protein [Flavihumibacter petaseus]GAO44499.1 putative DeoR family transcriptional regulator [Flavihumibacter petaseus NBRC 106054]
MNRIDRLTAILIQLQGRRLVKAQDIADRFGISLRTVYRDVKALEESGVPVLGEAGMGYTLMEGYRLPPVMFTREEAIAFLTAEKLVAQLTDSGNSEHYRSAMYKVRAVLRTTEKDLLENIDDHIEVLKSVRTARTAIDKNIQQDILNSIAGRRLIRLIYITGFKKERTERWIEPMGIFFLDGFWHLVAWCRMRNDYRDFRLDRIEKLETSSEQFRQQHPSLKSYLDKMYINYPLQEVVIEVPTDQVKYVGDQKYYMGLVSESEQNGITRMQFMSASLEGFARFYLTIGDVARIISPVQVKERVKQLHQLIAGNQ